MWSSITRARIYLYVLRIEDISTQNAITKTEECISSCAVSIGLEK